MASVFSADIKFNLIPKETVPLDDAIDSVSVIDSNVDKILGSHITHSDIGDFTTSVSAGSDFHYYEELLVSSTTPLVLDSALNLGEGVNGFDNAYKFIAYIKSAEGSLAPAVDILWVHGTTTLTIPLNGVGDFCIIPTATQDFLSELEIVTYANKQCRVIFYIIGSANA